VPFWCCRQCITATFFGAHTASKNMRISDPYFISFSPEVISPLSLYIVPCTWRVVKAYLEPVCILTVLLAASYRVHISAMSSSFCADVPGASAWASKTKSKVTIA
jgi:hypothetical protein